MEDKRNALFVEPGAYIQRIEKKKSPNKVIFQEPYESMPNYYMDHGVKKSDHECYHDKHEECEKSKSSPFDIKSLLPLFGSIGGLGNLGGVSNLLSSFNGGLKDVLASIMSNPEMLKSAIGLITKNKTSKSTVNHEIKKSDLEIKNYTKVE